MSSLPRVVVLLSGSGTNLQALIDSASKGELGAELVAVIANRPGAFGLERASNAGIATRLLDHTEYASREAFDQALMAEIDQFSPDLLVLAGFMRILTPAFTEHYLGKMLNIHPSLLPKYQGLHTHQRALDANEECHGVTVHFVTAELDGGPAAIQAIVPIVEGDDAASLAKRVQVQEHIIYPMAVNWLASGKLRYKAGKAWLDDAPLPVQGFQIDSRH